MNVLKVTILDCNKQISSSRYFPKNLRYKVNKEYIYLNVSRKIIFTL